MTTVPKEEPRKRRTSKTAPAGAEPGNLRAQGVRTRNAIIRISRKLLLESGPMEFSLRAVAVRARISVSNLQYYFPTRAAVLRAIMVPLVDKHLVELRAALESDASPEATLVVLIDRALQDAKDPQIGALWWNFFAIASADPECAQLLNDWYDTLTEEVAKLIRAANPARTAAESLHIAVLLISMVDGVSVHLGTERIKRPYMQKFDASFMAAARYLVFGEVAEERGR
ncbi:TetR/AcrR family transcriptional regulator [Paraburkholderia denitrificans]|uniref:TetR/AcrR family transcriptional regulator n=1 Tax=Paraburkholderia denitrificans TaxID=694025 RepID=A0ABW0JC83_9BURK